MWWQFTLPLMEDIKGKPKFEPPQGKNRWWQLKDKVKPKFETTQGMIQNSNWNMIRLKELIKDQTKNPNRLRQLTIGETSKQKSNQRTHGINQPIVIAGQLWHAIYFWSTLVPFLVLVFCGINLMVFCGTNFIGSQSAS